MSFTPNTTFYLIKDVDIDVSYCHEYYFSDATSQYNFFHSKIFKTVEGGTYQRKNANTITLPFQADEIREAKYLMWQNKNYSDKWYYAFVTLIDYVNPNVSNISYELDVYQTYLFDMNWKQSFINRKHCDRWLNKANNVPVINLEPETLDYGDSYEIIEQEELDGLIPGVSWAIMGFTEDMEATGSIETNSNINGVPTQFKYYFLPFSTAQDGNTYTFNYQSFPLTDLGNFLHACASESATVGKLVSVYITPYFPMGSILYTKSGTTYNITDTRLKYISFANTALALNCLRFNNGYNISVGERGYHTSMEIFNNYGYEESKLLMYPYSFIEMTTQRGDSLVIHNEYIDNGEGGTIAIDIYGSIAYRSTVMYIIRDYLTTIPYTSGQPKIYGLTDKSNLDMPIIDDYTASYLQANANSINVSRSNTLATLTTAQQNANANNTTALSVASRTQIANLGNSAINAIGALGEGASEGVMGAIGGAMKGITTAMTGTISAVKDYKNSLEEASTTLANAYRSSQTDYSNAIASVNAKVQDAQQVADTSRSMGGDYLFNVINNTDKLYFFKKTILPEYANKLTAYFKQYGYAYNRLEVPEFHTRASWNYFKMLEPNVSGNIPMNDLLKIRDIFMKGITLWHGDYIGDYSRNNDEV